MFHVEQCLGFAPLFQPANDSHRAQLFCYSKPVQASKMRTQ